MALRLIAEVSADERKHIAKVYKDSEWQEYRVKFTKDGKKLGEKCDYHTTDLKDAIDTADAEVKRFSGFTETAGA